MIARRGILAGWLGALTLPLALSGAGAAVAQPYGGPPPGWRPPPAPPLRFEPPPGPPPRPGWVRQPGHWAWLRGAYVWVPGRWRRQRPGRWREGYWAERRGRWVWVEPGWR
ncbi:hypothetical protein NON00_21855 [Roseomonas sp. GC11]|uniref:hypothetical protein n=1 Tax=Roseomonas sp. GC11 TaxID=2950546 RepID=UPI002109242E|nr:hypothetical protein [Roseomonas sp. GC11]MCQ4162558.1 hypothetical protein [Roseomonas sp. GC11]